MESRNGKKVGRYNLAANIRDGCLQNVGDGVSVRRARGVLFIFIRLRYYVATSNLRLFRIKLRLARVIGR